jgi:hypothetical protein
VLPKAWKQELLLRLKVCQYQGRQMAHRGQRFQQRQPATFWNSLGMEEVATTVHFEAAAEDAMQ